MIFRALLGILLTACGNGPCDYSSSCPKPVPAVVSACKDRSAITMAQPRCGAEYDAYLRCRSQNTICTADGQIDTNATFAMVKTACAAQRAPYDLCCSAQVGTKPVACFID